MTSRKRQRRPLHGGNARAGVVPAAALALAGAAVFWFAGRERTPDSPPAEAPRAAGRSVHGAQTPAPPPWATDPRYGLLDPAGLDALALRQPEPATTTASDGAPPAPDARAALTALAGSADPAARRLALFRLRPRLWRQEPRARALLLAALADPEPDLRAEALRLVRECAPDDAAPAVRARAGDESPEVRREAALAIGAFRDRDGLPELDALSRDPAPEVRRAALEGFLHFEEAVAVPALARMTGDEDLDLAVRAGDFLRRLERGDLSAPLVTRLVLELARPEPARRLAALDALGQLRATAARDDVTRCADDPDPEVARRARDVCALLSRTQDE